MTAHDRRARARHLGAGGEASPQPPFFIVGSARSGTTMLRLMLNAHPEVAVPPESRFITEMHHSLAFGTGSGTGVDPDRFLGALERHRRFQTWDLPVAAVAAEIAELDGAPTYADAIAAAFRAYARAQGKTRWGDKTPRYVEDIPLLAELWPEARFIHLIRDGRNVALSYADVSFGPKTVGRAARLWASRVSSGCSAGRALGPERYLEVRYEDLVEDAAGQVKVICGFLDLEFDPGMLDYTERARGSVLPRAAVYNPNVMQPPTQTRAWQTSMPASHVAAFEAVAGELLSDLGYERRFPSPGIAESLLGRLGAAGLPVGRIRSTAG
ncbi:MAG TPA: sulfotransferase [Vicinamibacterales bacterium]|nr:sulfotransferase [Vicinamibacterales bacterium]